jgi:hypothetical protein
LSLCLGSYMFLVEVISPNIYSSSLLGKTFSGTWRGRFP